MAINQDKSTVVIADMPKAGSTLTWDQATFTWNEAVGTWDNPYAASNQAKSSVTVSNQAKS